jgi:hypothetical protein
MTGSALPHSKAIAEQFNAFRDAVTSEIVDHSGHAATSAIYRGIFKNSLAAHAPLEHFRKNDLPLLKSASGIARRIPMLLMCRQLSLAYVELRRFIEVVSWYPYFMEHPVEWEEFSAHPEVGVVRDTADPIRFAAHREIAWHHAYIVSRFRKIEWIGEAVEMLIRDYAKSSAHVHAAIPALQGSVALPFDQITDADLRSFQGEQRRVLAAGCLVVAAAKSGSLSKLPPAERAWFDWLVGAGRATQIRASSVGAAASRPRRRG